MPLPDTYSYDAALYLLSSAFQVFGAIAAVTVTLIPILIRAATAKRDVAGGKLAQEIRNCQNCNEACEYSQITDVAEKFGDVKKWVMINNSFTEQNAEAFLERFKALEQALRTPENPISDEERGKRTRIAEHMRTHHIEDLETKIREWKEAHNAYKTLPQNGGGFLWRPLMYAAVFGIQLAFAPHLLGNISPTWFSIINSLLICYFLFRLYRLTSCQIKVILEARVVS